MKIIYFILTSIVFYILGAIFTFILVSFEKKCDQLPSLNEQRVDFRRDCTIGKGVIMINGKPVACVLIDFNEDRD